MINYDDDELDIGKRIIQS